MTNQVKRLVHWAMRLAMVAMVLGYLLVAAAPGEATSTLGRAPLDLPALTVRPADLADLGLEDYRASNGAWLGQEETVFQVAYDFKLDTDEVTSLMVDEAGVRGSYAVLISNIFLNDEGKPKSTRGVWATLYEFASPGGAEAGYRFFADRPFASLTDEAVALEMPTIGDASFSGQWEDTDSNSDDPMTYYGLGFRSGRVYGELLFWDIVRPNEAADPPTIDEFVGIARQAERRVERGLDGNVEDGGGLSLHVARFQADDPFVVMIGDRYVGIDGAPLHAFDESPDERDQRAEAMQTGGMIASYRVQQELVIGPDLATTDPRLMIQTEQYADADGASAGLQLTSATFQDCRCFLEIVAPEELPTLGDEMVVIGVTMPFGAEGSTGFLFLVRTGEFVSQIWLTSQEGETLDRALAIAEAQTRCALEGCATSMALPAALVA